jgi:predicted RNase H-like HicB family nuclease
MHLEQASKSRPKKRVDVYAVEIEREADGRFIAEIPKIAGCMVYGVTKNDAVKRVKEAALWAIYQVAVHGGKSVPAEIKFVMATP